MHQETGTAFQSTPIWTRGRRGSYWQFQAGRLIAESTSIGRHAFALGASPLNWRQGLKHDAAPVMELTADGPSGPFSNQLGEPVDVEPEFVFPLLKGADLRKPRAHRPRRAVIVTQQRIGQETASLEQRAPRLFAYLRRHADRFAARKSSIYRKQPEFAIFGIGPYSFAPFKVAISGLHRPAVFQALGPMDDRPVMVDDTCYLVPCREVTEAAILTVLCNDPISLELLAALSFPDAKRAVTKGLLQRLDLSAILSRVDRAELSRRAGELLALELGHPPDSHREILREIDRLERTFAMINTPDPDSR